MKLKIAICIPSYGDPKGKFVQCLADMLSHIYQAKFTNTAGELYEPEVNTMIVSSSMLTESRHRLCAEAVLWGADFMLFMDADHTFPPDTFARLWAKNLAIVGCNYARRCTPTAPTAAKIVTDDQSKDHKNLCYTTAEKHDQGLVEAVTHMGFGVCLINMRVFDALQAQAEKEGRKSFLPLFVFEPTADHTGMIGEDVYFFRKCREAGLTPHIDHALSWEVGHIHEQIMTNAHADAQQEAWAERAKNVADKFNPDLVSAAA